MGTHGNFLVVDHPLIAHKLSLLRSKGTPSVQFRALMREIALLLGSEVLRDLPTELRDIETPVGPARVPFLAGKKLVPESAGTFKVEGTTFVGLLIGTVLSFILMGDALRDALDPKLR